MPDALVIDESNADDYRAGHVARGRPPFGYVGDGGFYVRPMYLRRSEAYKGHVHKIDHLHRVVRGAVRITAHKGEEAWTIEAMVPCYIPIAKDWWHEFEPLSDTYDGECLFARAEADALLLPDRDRYYLEAGA